MRFWWGDKAWPMVMHGFDSTLPCGCIHDGTAHGSGPRGAPQSFIVADMPFPDPSPGQSGPALRSGRCARQAGANAVKIEGAAGHL